VSKSYPINLMKHLANIDIWINLRSLYGNPDYEHNEEGDHWILISTERSRKMSEIRDWNFDVLSVSDGFLHAPHENMKTTSGTLAGAQRQLGGERRFPYYGIELEVMQRKERVGRKLTATVVLDQLGRKFAILKYDSSIGGNGFEIVSTPATLAYHKTAWNKFFDKDEGVCQHLKSYHTGTCGMHVHISRDAFLPLHHGKFVVFYNAKENLKFIERTAGRGKNSYCKFVNKGIKDGLNNPRSGDKYEAVNVKKKDTLEVRIFRGNVKKAGFIKNIEFCDATYHFTKEASHSKLTYEDFLNWLKDPKNGCRYMNLLKFLMATKYLNPYVLYHCASSVNQ